ncbi:MAG: hypothetical protein ACK56W_07695, partial [Pirellula sp.]
MAIKVACASCSSVHSVNDRLAGRAIRCPHCDAFIQVPLPSATATDEIVEVELIEEDVAEVVEIVESTDNGAAAVEAEVLDENSLDARASDDKFRDDEEEVEEISFPKKELPKDDMD